MAFKPTSGACKEEPGIGGPLTGSDRRKSQISNRILVKYSEIIQQYFPTIFLLWTHPSSLFQHIRCSASFLFGAGRPQILAVAVVSSSLRNWRERQFVRATWGHPDIVRISGVGNDGLGQ